MRVPVGAPLIAKIAMGGAIVTVGMGVATFMKHQEEMKSSLWFRTVRDKLNSHPGVKLLIGDPPIAIGALTRRKPTYELPSVVIDPPAPHLVTMNVSGDKGKGILFVWLNNPDKKKIESVDDWNIANVELQIGNNSEKKMPISLS